jgi:hypothetical protein
MGTEGAAAVMRHGLFDGTGTVEWRRSLRSSSDPNYGIVAGIVPAGYEVGEGETLAARSSTSALTKTNRGNPENDDQN